MRLLTLGVLGLGCGVMCGQQAAGGDAAKPDQTTSASVPAEGQAVAPMKAAVASPGEKLDPAIKKGSEQDVEAVGTR